MFLLCSEGFSYSKNPGKTFFSVVNNLFQSNRQYTVYGELFKNRKLVRDRILSFN